MKAAEMAAEGKRAEEIYQECLDMTARVEASFVIDSLDYLYKGGRCSGLAAFGANVLKLKPSIVVKDGIMTPEKKYRGAFDNVILRYVQDLLLDRQLQLIVVPIHSEFFLFAKNDSKSTLRLQNTEEYIIRANS